MKKEEMLGCKQAKRTHILLKGLLNVWVWKHKKWELDEYLLKDNHYADMLAHAGNRERKDIRVWSDVKDHNSLADWKSGDFRHRFWLFAV